jgi:hypothetical protein
MSLSRSRRSARIILGLMAVAIVLFVAWRMTIPTALVHYLEKISANMTTDDVREMVPRRFFVAEEAASDQQYVADRVFAASGCVSRILVYAETKGERFADARVFVDDRGVVVGLSYTADGLPPLKRTISDGIGPQGARVSLRACE